MDLFVQADPAYDYRLAAELRGMMEAEGSLHKFYCRAPWLRLRAKVLTEFHGECYDCAHATPARYVPASCVHHERHVEDFPGWALSEWVPDGQGGLERNLWPLCHDCHDKRHGRFAGMPPEKRFGFGAAPPLTVEKW